MMKRRWKPVLAVILTLAALVASLNILSLLFVPKKWSSAVSTTEMWRGFYDEPRDTIDVLYIGPSTMYNGVLPTEIYLEHGYTGYVLAAPRLRYGLAELYIKEACRYQKPKLVVLDDMLFSRDYYAVYETRYRTALDTVRFSFDKLKVVWEIASEDPRQSVLSYVFPLLRYHDRWNNLSDNDVSIYWRSAHNAEKGFYSVATSVAYDYGQWKMPTDAVDDAFAASALKSLDSIMAFCEQNDIQLMMLNMPVTGKTATAARSNAATRYFTERGYRYLDLNSLDIVREIGLDFARDFSDDSHLNVFGAAKATKRIGEYITLHYQLDDRRGDNAIAAAWEADARSARATVLKKITAKKVKSPVVLTPGKDGVTVDWSRIPYFDSVTLRRKDANSDEWQTLHASAGERLYFDAGDIPSCTYEITLSATGHEDRAVTFKATYKKK